MKNVKIKSIHLKNFCGFKDSEFSFLDSKLGIKQVSVLYGQNGLGKSSLLNAINIISNPHQYENREVDLIFKKCTYNEDYDLSSTAYKQAKGIEVKNHMELTGIFDSDEGEKRVIIDNYNGVILNDLGQESQALFLDIDNPSNLNIFQLADSPLSSNFIDFGKMIYGFDCFFDFGENGSKIVTEGNINFITDFAIKKYGTCTVRFRNFSAGEKKIAKLLENLCNYENMNKFSLILIDNIDIHVYFLRHPRIIDILGKLTGKQFIITSHSGTMINYVRETYGEDSLYDLEQYKLKELGLSDKNLIT